MDILATFWENFSRAWWVVVLWIGGYNTIGPLTRARARYLPENWLTAPDRAIPRFEPGWDAFYILGFVFPLYPMFILQGNEQFWTAIWAYVITLGASFSIFLAWPVKMERPPARGTRTTPLFRIRGLGPLLCSRQLTYHRTERLPILSPLWHRP